MVDPSDLIRILDRQPDHDRAALLDALAPAVARHVRRMERDAAIRTIAQSVPEAGQSERARAEAVERELRRYGSTQWRMDRGLSAMPAGYRGTPKAALFLAYQAARGRPPLGLSQLREILRTGR